MDREPAYSPTEVAEEAGLTEEQVAWLLDLGLLRGPSADGYPPGDVFRAKMMAALLEAGFTERQVEDTVTAGGLDLRHVDHYVLIPPTERSPRTFEELGRELGAEPGALEAAYQLLGVATPEPGAHLPVDEERLVRELFGIWRLGRDRDAVLRAARLAGEGTRMATNGWGALLAEQIAGPAQERWLRREVDEYPREAVDAATRMFALLPSLVEWLIQRFIEQTVTSGITENFERVLASLGLGPPPEPTAPPSVVFVDITGYTAMTERHGDEAAVGVATGLQRHAERVASAHGGRLVKLLGDGAMLQLPTATDGIDAALELVDRLQRDLGIDAHAGVHAGRVIDRDRDLFGSTVNLASRIADAAEAGQVLVTDAVHRLVDHRADVQPADPVQLQGYAEPVVVYRVASPH
jgi:class 3 adenylate cyclase